MIIREIYQRIERWIMAKQERTWVGHGVWGFVYGFLLDVFGAGLALGHYGHKEYIDWKNKSSNNLDYIMDFLCPQAGAWLGVFVRRLVL